jgi:hypothetical protein
MTDGIVDALKRAVAAVEEAGVPEDLREEAFRAALASEGLQPAPAASGAVGKGDSSPVGEGPPSDASEPLQKIAKKLKLDPALVGRIFEIDGDTVHLLVSTSDLDSKASVSQQEITLLVIAARQAAGLDDELTHVKEVREIAKEFGVFDSNFSGNITPLKGSRIRFTGSAATRQFKMNQPGFEAAAAIVKRLAEQSS